MTDQKPLFDGVEPKPLPPIPDHEVISCSICGTPLDAEGRCAKCSRRRGAGR